MVFIITYPKSIDSNDEDIYTVPEMKAHKEITVAIIIGLIIGAVVVGGVIRARKALTTSRETTPTTSSPLPMASAEESDGLFLTLETPDNRVYKEPEITIAGKTLTSTYIVINGEAGDSIIVPDTLGNFSQDIKLVKGANTIKVTVYQEDGTKREQTITAVYTTAEI